MVSRLIELPSHCEVWRKLLKTAATMSRAWRYSPAQDHRMGTHGMTPFDSSLDSYRAEYLDPSASSHRTTQIPSTYPNFLHRDHEHTSTPSAEHRSAAHAHPPSHDGFSNGYVWDSGTRFPVSHPLPPGRPPSSSATFPSTARYPIHPHQYQGGHSTNREPAYLPKVVRSSGRQSAQERYASCKEPISGGLLARS